MSKPQNNPERGLHLTLTDEQRKQLVHGIADSGHAELDIDLLFEGNVDARTVAPVAVLVGNAI